MGYIPPIRDEQLIQYGNRMSYSENNIKPLSPVIRGEFQGVLDKQTKQSLHYRKKAAQKQRNKINHHIIQEMTGKGYFIDEVI